MGIRFFLFAVLAAPAIALAQTTMITGFNNVYSPFLQFIGGELKMYYGGWEFAPPAQVRDTIYRARCHHPQLPCASEGAIQFWDDDAFRPVPEFLQAVNDPTIVDVGGYFILYFTACPRNVDCMARVDQHRIYYSVSWLSDGLYWSKPVELKGNAWLPSVTKSSNGEIMLYYTVASNGALRRLNLGRSGLDTTARCQAGICADRAVTTPQWYFNVEVRYQPSIGLYQMVGESAGSQRIDYLHSADGVHFWGARTVARPSNGNIQIRTPAMHPHSASWLYFGQTQSPLAMENQIYFRTW